MDVDLYAARQFVYANARTLDRRRLEYLLEEGSSEGVVETSPSPTTSTTATMPTTSVAST